MSHSSTSNCLTHSFYIKFYPGIKTSLGCEKAPLILGRLEYWFEKYAKGFYKFIEPCNHPLYREGDSWSEELGLSRKLFAKAFDLIGVRYISKSAYLNSEDKFQGKLYASYHDRKTNRTYFVRNHEFAAQFIKSLFKRKPPSSCLKKKEEVPKKNQLKEISTSTHSSSFQGRSRNGPFGRSYGGDYRGGKNKDILIQKKTPSLEHTQPEHPANPHPGSNQQDVMEGMIKIWKEEIGELGVSTVSDNLIKNLSISLRQFFNQSLDQWKSYCRMIASSKFLMGEAQNKFFKRAWITWAIKEQAIQRIKGGEFNLGDRPTNTEKQLNEINNSIKNLENKKIEIKEKIKNIKCNLYNNRKINVKEKIKTLSEDEKENLEAEFIQLLHIENNSITEEFRKFGWKGSFVESYFNAFTEEKIESQLFISSSQEDVDEAIKTSGFLKLLESICDEIYLLEQKRRQVEKEKII